MAAATLHIDAGCSLAHTEARSHHPNESPKPDRSLVLAVPWEPHLVPPIQQLARGSICYVCWDGGAHRHTRPQAVWRRALLADVNYYLIPF